MTYSIIKILESQNLSSVNILPKEGEVYLYPEFFSVEESNFLFKNLFNEVQWKQEPIVISGKQVMQPRLTALYGDFGKSYRYSGINMNPIEWSESLVFIKKRIEGMLNLQTSTALLNLYRNEQDSMGWHRDNERELGKNPTIVSVSFGATRTFLLRNYYDKELKFSLNLSNGSVLFMSGQTQHFWSHSVPKLKDKTESRINITFRLII